MMRRHVHIVWLALLALVTASCLKEPFNPTNVLPPDDGKVTIDGTLALPVTDDNLWTKSMQDRPKVKKLYVAVFDDADMLYEIVEARPGTHDNETNDYVPEGSDYLTHFHVTLTRVEQGVRYVEFIAVGRDMPELMRVNLVDESTLASTLVVDDDTEAYFCRRRFEHIVNDANLTNMHNLPMIRNFAKVTLDVSGVTTSVQGATVQITGFKVFNVPTDGMIAPFNANAPTTAEVVRTINGEDETIVIPNPDCFAKYEYLPAQNAYASLTKGFDYELPGSNPIVTVPIPKYTGYMSNTVQFDNFASQYNAGGTTDDDFVFCPYDGADFLYECTYRAGADNPFIILKAKWTPQGGDEETCYYKADFVYKEQGANEFYHILRNFQYTLSVKNIAEKGASTIYDAVNGIAMNNFESSTMSQSLTNISNGESRLYISATDRLVTTGRLDTLYLRNRVMDEGEWKWDTHTEGTILNGVKTGTGYPSGQAEYKKGEVVGRDTDLISYCTFSLVQAGDPDAAEWKDWVRVEITMPEPYDLRKGMVWKQPVTFFNEQGLSRVCMITRRQPFELGLDVQDYVARNKGQSVKVDISLPAGLTEARFPIEFYIEQEQNTLYPDPSQEPALPVTTGLSIIPGRSGNNYYYTRILDWTEYKNASEDVNGTKVFSSYFKTLVEDSATTLWVMPRQSDGYFSILDEVEGVFLNKDSFVNTQGPASISFEQSNLVVKVGQELTNVATATSGATVVYESADPTIATVTASGKVKGVSTGQTQIRATCPATGAYYAVTTPVICVVDVVDVAKDLPELTVRWKKEPIYFYYVGAADGKVLAKAFTKSSATPSITYTSSDTNVAEIRLVDGEYYVHPKAAGTTTITATATVAASGTYVAETQKITYDVRVVGASDKAPSGTVLHHETFLERGTSDPDARPGYTEIQSDYTERWITKPNGYNIHGQNTIWHLHPDGDFGAYASSWYNNRWNDVESWLVSREIDLTASQSAKLTFSHAGEYHRYPALMMPYAHVMIAESGEYGDLDAANGYSSGTWVDISPVASQYPYPDYKYVAAAIDLTPYAGKRVRIAFRYIGHDQDSDGNGSTWEIKNVKITEN